MKIWLAYKFRGDSVEDVRAKLNEITRLLKDKGHQVVTMAEDIQHWNFDPAVMSKAEAVRQAYQLARECDLLLALHDTDAASEGRGWETGYFAGLGKPTILAVAHPVNNPFNEALFTENPSNASVYMPSVIRFDTFEEIAACF